MVSYYGQGLKRSLGEALLLKGLAPQDEAQILRRPQRPATADPPHLDAAALVVVLQRHEQRRDVVGGVEVGLQRAHVEWLGGGKQKRFQHAQFLGARMQLFCFAGFWHAAKRCVVFPVLGHPRPVGRLAAVLDGRRTAGLPVDKTNWANVLDTPPFEAYAVTCGVTFTFGGLKVTNDCEVEDTAGTPIPGLFAAGELVGGLFYHNYPGGTGLTSGAVFGRIAGNTAGQYVAR